MRSILTILLFLVLPVAAQAREISNVDSPQPWDVVKPSQKGADYTLRNAVITVESTKERYRHRILGFHEVIDYPEYSGISFYPFYSGRFAGDRSMHWFFPLYRFETSPDATSFYSALYYARNDSNGSLAMFPAVPLLYMHANYEAGSATSLATIFQWKRYRDGSLKSFWIHGLAYYGQGSQGDYLHILPIYSRVKSENYGYELFLPFYLDVKTKEGDYYANFLGYTRSSVNVSVGSNERGSFLDVDTGFFYGLFSLSHRFAVNRASVATTEDKEDLLFDEANFQTMDSASAESLRPHLKKSDSLDRTASLDYHSWKAFWGILAYKKSDDWRHFRFLPLSYLTWNTKSDDQVLLLPPVLPIFARYQSGLDGYTVVFPFYGNQRDAHSRRSVYAAGLVYHSSDDTDKSAYTSVIWPLFQHSTSANGSWSMLFPVYFDTASESGQVSYRTNFSPLHFYRKGTQGDRVLSRTVINPLQISYSDESSRTAFLPIPFIFSSRNDERTNTFMPAFLSYFHQSDKFDLDLGVLGALWFRYRDENTERKMVLMGAVYQGKESERETSSGSAWGLLWEKSHDAEGSHFSVGKFLVRYDSSDTDTNVRILGIPII